MDIIKSDAQGFLVGDPLTIMDRSISIWRDIRRDVRAIRHALNNAPTIERARRVAAAIPRARDALGRFTVTTPAVPRSRDAQGRFIAQPTAAPGQRKQAATARSVATPSRAGRVATPTARRIPVGRLSPPRVSGTSPIATVTALPRRIVNAARTADPVARAVGEVAQPLSRGYQIALADRGERRKERWFSRIWNELKGFRGESSAFDKAAKKSLKAIEEKPEGGPAGGGSGLLGLVGALLRNLPGLGLLGKLPGAAAALGGLGKGVLRGGKGLLRGAGRLLRRVPVFGSLFALGGFAADVYGNERDSSLTPEQRRAANLRAGVGAAGGLLGGAVGLLGGPVGAVVGGILGERFGKWLSEQEFGKTIESMAIAAWSRMTSAWESVTQGAQDLWVELKQKFTSVIEFFEKIVLQPLVAVADYVGAKADQANNAIARTTGVNIKSSVRGAGEAARESALTATEYLADVAKSLVGGGSRANKAAVVEELTRSGITDRTERASILAQLDHESGGFRRLNESFNYRPSRLLKTFPKYFRDLDDARAVAAGGPEAIANRVYGGRLGNERAGDGYKYHGRGFIQLTGKDNYAAAGKALGLDLVGNPDLAADPKIAARIALWYWKSRPGLPEAGRNGDVRAVTRVINGGSNGLRERSALFQQYLAQGQTIANAPPLASAGLPTAPTLPTRTVSAPAPSAPTIPPPPTIAEAPPIPIPLSSNGRKESLTVTMAPQDAGQDVRDRGIAHIVTGGYARAP